MLSGHGCLFYRQLVLLTVFILSPCLLQAGEYRILGGQSTQSDDAAFLAAIMQRHKSLIVADTELPYELFSDAPTNAFEAPLSHCGYGFEPCADAEGKVCVIARGTITFDEKVANCEAGGGVAVIIFNYLSNSFLGMVGEAQELPVLAVSNWAGQKLIEHIGEVVTHAFDDDVESASFFCGGSYLGDGWVLTAAHCVDDRQAENLWLALGGGDYRDGRELYGVQAIYPHQSFSAISAVLSHDVALLKLDRLPDVAESIVLADGLDQQSAVAAFDYVQVYGRGEQEVVSVTGGAGSSSMSYRAYTTDMQLVDRISCRQGMPGEVIDSDMICAGSSFTKGTCFGDSGGPLVWQRDGQRKLLGVVSWGTGCGVPGRYDVFASVASYRAAIEALMAAESASLEGETNLLALLADGDINDQVAAEDALAGGGGGSMFYLLALMFLYRLMQTKPCISGCCLAITGAFRRCG